MALTALGRAQGRVPGQVLRRFPARRPPEVVWCSPYLRAKETWRLAQRA
ncbi:hypothetical protein [Nonomuraea dietziae]